MLFDKRRTYYIQKDFQLRFILRFVGVATVWAVTTILLFTYLAEKRMDSIRYSSHVDIKTMGDLMLPVTVGVQMISLLAFAAILATTIDSLWKRLSPPLFSIKKDIMRIARGDLASEVSLSKDEEFQKLAADLDDMRIGIRDQIVPLKEHQALLTSAADDLVRSTLEGKPSLQPATALREAVERMKVDVQFFHY